MFAVRTQRLSAYRAIQELVLHVDLMCPQISIIESQLALGTIVAALCLEAGPRPFLRLTRGDQFGETEWTIHDASSDRRVSERISSRPKRRANGEIHEGKPFPNVTVHIALLAPLSPHIESTDVM